MTTAYARSLLHVRPVIPLEFREQEPDSEHLAQSGRHFLMLMALHEILREAAGEAHTVSCDAFHYFDASNPERVLSPDGTVKLGVPHHLFDTWKMWERGAPDLACEVLSDDTPEHWTLEEKVDRYNALGVVELVVFQVDAKPGHRLRVWDRIDGDFVERVVDEERTPCLTLGLFFVIAPVGELPSALRLARDADGKALVPTLAEELAILRKQARVDESLREARQRLAKLEGSRE